MLERFYNIDLSLQEQYINPKLIEAKLKEIYGKQYNNLTKVDELKLQKNGTYLIASDFKMMITSLGALFGDKERKENYEKDWNRNKISSQGICCSYITNDFIGTASIPNLCYGFIGMPANSLLLSCPHDMHSNSNRMNPTAGDREDESYYTPENQINQTVLGYNEMVWSRNQNGIRKQPDYIVVFQENGKTPNMKQARIAARHWKAVGIEMPIIVVDKDKCLANNKKEIEEEINSCKSLEELNRIKHRIANNQKWSRQSFKEFDEKIAKIEEEYTSNKNGKNDEEKKKIREWKKGLEKAYNETTSKQRKKIVDVIQHMVRIKEEFER